MADYNSSLPVRTQNNGDVVIELADGTTPSQKAAVNASGSVQIAGQGVAGTPAGGVVSVQGVSGGTTLTISGSVTANQGTAAALSGAWPVEITDGTNILGSAAHPVRIDPTGTTTQPVSGTVAVSSVSGTVAVTQSTSPWVDNITQIGGSAIALGQTTMSASLPVAIASNQSNLPNNIVQISGASPSASNSLPIQISTGAAFVSASNPLPVTIDPAAAGTPKNYYTDSAAVAVGSSATQSTTAAGVTGFYLQSVILSGSGKFKAVIQIGGTSYAAVFNSTATPTVQINFPNNTLVATGTTVAAIMTNNDLAAQDLYSTFIGFQV
jgi:hypothetical protein